MANLNLNFGTTVSGNLYLTIYEVIGRPEEDGDNQVLSRFLTEERAHENLDFWSRIMGYKHCFIYTHLVFA